MTVSCEGDTVVLLMSGTAVVGDGEEILMSSKSTLKIEGSILTQSTLTKALGNELHTKATCSPK